MTSQHRFKTLMLPLCAACLLIAGWMVYHSLTGTQLAGCGAGSACDSVMGSRWAWMLGGVPVSLPAAVVYLLLGICILFLGGHSAESKSLDRTIWRLMPLLGGCIVGAALWFAWLQAGVLHAFCKYCTALHVLGCIASVIILINAKKAGFRPFIPFVAGLVAAAVFAFVQARTLPEAVYDSGRSAAELPTFTAEEVPVLEGGQDVQQEFTLLFDFQCIHCRRLHTYLPEFMELTEGKFRISLCPVPLSSACNPYIPDSYIDRFAGSCQLTRYAMAVWYARPEAYADFWDWMLGDGDEHAVIDIAEAESRARAILGNNFEAAIQDRRIDSYLRKVEELFGRTSSSDKSGVPRFIHGQHWLIPETDDAESLLKLLRAEFQL